MENEVLFEEVNNEVSTEVVEETNTPAPAAEGNDEMGLGEAIVKLVVTGLAVTGAVTVGKKVAGGAKKLFGKFFGKKGKDEDEATCNGDCSSCESCEEDE